MPANVSFAGNNNRRHRRASSARTARHANNRLLQTDGVSTPGMQMRVTPVRGPILPRRELKYLDTAAATYAIDTTGSVTLLNGVAQGDDNNLRNGRQTMARGVGLSGLIYVTTGSLVPQVGRVLLVWDNATDGILPTVANILSASTSVSFHNVDFESRFTILYDRCFPLGAYSNADGAAFGDGTPRLVDVFIPLSAVTQYIGTGATVASMAHGGLFLVTIGNIAPGSTDATSTLAARVRFSDED